MSPSTVWRGRPRLTPLQGLEARLSAFRFFYKLKGLHDDYTRPLLCTIDQTLPHLRGRYREGPYSLLEVHTLEIPK